jgi:hypothetical protein
MNETPIYDLLVSVRVGPRPVSAEASRTTEAGSPEPEIDRGAHRVPQPRASGRHHRANADF